MPEAHQQHHTFAVAVMISWPGLVRIRLRLWTSGSCGSRLIVIHFMLETIVKYETLPLSPAALLSTTFDPRLATPKN